MKFSTICIGISRMIGLVAGLALASAVTIAAEDTSELDNVRETVSGMFEGINPENVFRSEIDGWYTVRSGAIIAYISADGRYLLQGDLIDLEKQINLSEVSRNDARVEMLGDLNDEQLIVFTPEDRQHSVSIFTDIDCTYCRRLHSQIDEYMAAGIEVRYFLYPRSGPNTPSWAKAEEVWCADDQNSALTMAKLDQKFESDSCDASILTTHFSLGQDVGLRGTPAIVLEDGTLLSGYLPPQQLSQALAASVEE